MSDGAAKIGAAIAWYRRHRTAMAAAMPLRLPHLLFHPHSLDCLDTDIQRYEAGELSVYLAEAYILGRARELRAALALRDLVS